KTALENGQQNVVYTVCKNLPYSKTLAWGAILGRQEEIDLIFTQPDFGIHKGRKSMYRAMAMAAHNGHFDIVNEKCGKEIFREDESSDEEEEEEGDWRGGRAREESNDGSDCPLASAFKVGRLDIAKYLYTNDGYKASSLEKVLVGAASSGPLELVMLCYYDGRY
ncbi:hypothetical protein JG688_00012915, partial [Phytophthora aleatoria]